MPYCYKKEGYSEFYEGDIVERDGPGLVGWGAGRKLIVVNPEEAARECPYFSWDDLSDWVYLKCNDRDFPENEHRYDGVSYRSIRLVTRYTQSMMVGPTLPAETTIERVVKNILGE